MESLLFCFIGLVRTCAIGVSILAKFSLRQLFGLYRSTKAIQSYTVIREK